MANQTFIIVKTQFESTHNYPEAPVDVAFLRNTHRHIFYIEVEVQVFNDDRELEFILVKRDLEQFCELVFTGKHLGRISCEQIAQIIQDHLHKTYPVPELYLLERIYRKINVRVFEDGENGVYLQEL